MKVRQDHLPKGSSKRPGKLLDPQYLTIHNTGNPKSTARNERQWLSNPANIQAVSWHWVIDEKEVIEAIPLNEVAWHAGPEANRVSIGIEICESGNWDKTRAHAIEHVAALLYQKGWGVDRMKKHQDWTGKYCPKKLIPEWPSFVQAVAKQLSTLKTNERK